MTIGFARLGGAVGTFAVTVGLCACTARGTADVTGSTIAKTTIEQVASKQISARFGAGTYKVACPHDLAAKKGASMTCLTVFPDGEKFNGTALITSVRGGKASWSYTPSSNPTK